MKILTAAAMVAALSAPALACAPPLPPAPPAAVHHANATIPIAALVVAGGVLLFHRHHKTAPATPEAAYVPFPAVGLAVPAISCGIDCRVPTRRVKPCHILTPKQKAAAQAAIHKLHEEKRRDTAAERKQAEELANDCRFKGDWFTLPVDDNGE